MVRKGYASMTVDEQLSKDLDSIADKENCRTRPEVIRRLVKLYVESETLKRMNEKRNLGLYRSLASLSPFEFLPQGVSA